MTTVKNIYDYINSIAPFDTQEEWDNSGHLVGEFRKEVKRVVLSLDCTKAVATYAKEVRADLVISHHPVIFSPISDIKGDTALYTLLSNDIAQISVHTNFDISCEGINFNLANVLELNEVKQIEDSFVVVGELENAMSIDDLAEYVSDKLDVAGIRYTDTDKEIKKVALAGGACSEYIDLACTNADCFVTGDLKYHDMLDASEMGYAVVSAGHYETENMPFLMLKDKLETIFTDVEFLVAPRKNPIKSI
jgi:dinuclear metal center YbgI/SA1388 family protein